jgi:flavin reductase (DIM6/NTAB) family NADH-FMN oxidoreductase RutF
MDRRTDLSRSAPQLSFDGDRFREVLGHYPTGVAIVTAVLDGGQPIGMVVGSFTAVSLDPPLVAFLPDRSSSTYARLRGVSQFVVNVLSAEQEDLCRVFSSKRIVDKWESVSWSPTTSGVPLLDGAVAWIECDSEATYEAGDHDIVIGRVKNLEVANPALPLLFFQGGYGRFAPASLVVPSEVDLLRPVRVVEIGRPEIERLANELGVECVAQAKVNNDLVLIASSGEPGGGRSPKIVGRRVPHVPPIGALFVAWAGDEAIEGWFRRLAVPLEVSQRQLLLEGLHKVRKRGWSIALTSPSRHVIEAAESQFSTGRFTPVQERELLRLMSGLSGLYEPTDLNLEGDSAVRMIGAPVFGTFPSVEVVLQLWDLPSDLGARQITEFAERLKAAAAAVTAAISLQGMVE